jgi:hypothetical protein
MTMTTTMTMSMTMVWQGKTKQGTRREVKLSSVQLC